MSDSQPGASCVLGGPFPYHAVNLGLSGTLALTSGAFQFGAGMTDVAAMCAGAAALLVAGYLLLFYTTEIRADALILRRPIGGRVIARNAVTGVELAGKRVVMQIAQRGRQVPLAVPIPYKGPGAATVHAALVSWQATGSVATSQPGETPSPDGTATVVSRVTGRLFASPREHHAEGLSKAGVGAFVAYVAIEAMTSYGPIGMLGLPVAALALVSAFPYVREVWAIDADEQAVIVRWPLRKRLISLATLESVEPHWEKRAVTFKLGSGESFDVHPGAVERIDEICRTVALRRRASR